MPREEWPWKDGTCVLSVAVTALGAGVLVGGRGKVEVTFAILVEKVEDVGWRRTQALTGIIGIGHGSLERAREGRVRMHGGGRGGTRSAQRVKACKEPCRLIVSMVGRGHGPMCRHQSWTLSSWLGSAEGAALGS